MTVAPRRRIAVALVLATGLPFAIQHIARAATSLRRSWIE